MTTGSVIQATTFIGVPHLGQSNGSTSKTFWSTRAHAERRSASGEPGSAGTTGSASASLRVVVVSGVVGGAGAGIAVAAARTRPRNLWAYAP